MRPKTAGTLKAGAPFNRKNRPFKMRPLSLEATGISGSRGQANGPAAYVELWISAMAVATMVATSRRGRMLLTWQRPVSIGKPVHWMVFSPERDPVRGDQIGLIDPLDERALGLEAPYRLGHRLTSPFYFSRKDRTIDPAVSPDPLYEQARTSRGLDQVRGQRPTSAGENKRCVGPPGRAGVTHPDRSFDELEKILPLSPSALLELRTSEPGDHYMGRSKNRVPGFNSSTRQRENWVDKTKAAATKDLDRWGVGPVDASSAAGRVDPDLVIPSGCESRHRLVYMGRSLAVKKNEGKGPTRRKLSSSRFSVAELDVGHQPLDDASLESCFHTSDEVVIELNAPERKLALEFKSRNSVAGRSGTRLLRVAIAMKQISVATLHEGSGGCHELVIKSRRPPFLHRPCESQDGMEAMVALAFRSLFSTYASSGPTPSGQVSRASGDANSWSPLEHGNWASDVRWERTIDPTGGSNAFGTHVTYRLIMSDRIGSRNDKQLVTALREFNVQMQGGPTLPRGVSIRCSTPDPSRFSDWSGGFSHILRHLPFEQRYLIHALIASHQLIIRSEEDARSLAAAPMKWLHDDGRAPLRGRRMFDSYVKRCGRSISEAEIRRVFVTPLRICPQPPELDAGNRIIRENAAHRDRFVRVTFVDENFSNARAFTSSEDVMDGRIRRIVHEGMIIAGRRFHFLAFSNSQLKEQSAWFYDEDPNDPYDRTYRVAAHVPTADEIRQSMGDLSGIRIVGKYAARLGQGLSASTPTGDIIATQVVNISDIEVTRGGKTFCLQPRGSGYDLSTRQCAVAARIERCVSAVSTGNTEGRTGPSYGRSGSGNVKHQNLEVLARASPLKCFLNRQVIVLLSAVGISDDAVMALFNRALAAINAAAHQDVACRSLLRSIPSGTVEQLGRNMLDAGFSVRTEPFLHTLVVAACNRYQLDLQLKARINVPMAVSLIGVLDETKRMQPGSVFFQVSGGWENPTAVAPVPAGTRVLVYRNPCLHPGDVQVFQTVDIPALHHLVDVLVFPATGDRPHPDELAGGDLDGDIYSVIWDPSLVPNHTHPAMEAGASAPPQTVDGAITSKHIGDFFVDYMKNDNLGFIANAHLRLADSSADGALNPLCLELAQLHSRAVDYNKTGVPATISQALCDILKQVPYPDFMEPVGREVVESQKVLGVIYRKAKQSAEQNNRILQTQGFEQEAYEVLNAYNNDLWELLQKHELDGSAEGEALSGCARSFSRKYCRDRYKYVHDAQGRLNVDVSKLKKEYRDHFWRGLGVEEATVGEGGKRMIAAQQKASAWYLAAYRAAWYDLVHNGLPPFFSFPWTVSDVLCEIKSVEIQRVAQRPYR
eukprot:gene10051-7944_t